MLQQASQMGNEHIVGWLPCGKAFKIHKPKEFSEFIMPQYFNQTKYRSFQRQLHIYGFVRVQDKTSVDNGAYRHELFIRGEDHLSVKMTRQKIKGTGTSNEERKRRSIMSKSRQLHHSHQSDDAVYVDDEIKWTYPQQSMQQHQLNIWIDQNDVIDQRSHRIGLSSLYPEAVPFHFDPFPISPKAARQGKENSAKMMERTHPRCQNHAHRHDDMIVRRNSFGERRDSLLGVISRRRGSLLFDGDEVSFGGKKFFFTASHK